MAINLARSRLSIRGYVPNDATLVVLEAKSPYGSVVGNAVIAALWLAGVTVIGDVFMAIAAAIVLSILLLIFGALVQFVAVVAVERERVVLVQYRQLSGNVQLHVATADLAEVVHTVVQGYAHSVSFVDRDGVELQIGIGRNQRHSKKRGPWLPYDAIINRTGVAFPPDARDVEGTAKALMAVVESIGVSVRSAVEDSYPRIQYWKKG